MLAESKQKQNNDALRYKNEEKQRVEQLAAEINEEKNTKAIRKVQERQAAMKVIKENMTEKKKRIAELDEIKKRDQEQIEVNMRLALEKELAREQEMANRGKRIQAVMDSMGEVIRDNDKELMRKQEKLYIQQCIEKDEQAHLQDIDRKNKERVKHQQLNDDLTQQVREKKMKKESDARANAQYMN